MTGIGPVFGDAGLVRISRTGAGGTQRRWRLMERDLHDAVSKQLG